MKNLRAVPPPSVCYSLKFQCKGEVPSYLPVRGYLFLTCGVPDPLGSVTFGLSGSVKISCGSGSLLLQPYNAIKKKIDITESYLSKKYALAASTFDWTR
jgi:hypothetical protein